MENGYSLDYWRNVAKGIYLAYDGDNEATHGDEDGLLERFVRAVAEGNVTDPQAAARVLVEDLLALDRVRWYS